MDLCYSKTILIKYIIFMLGKLFKRFSDFSIFTFKIFKFDSHENISINCNINLYQYKIVLPKILDFTSWRIKGLKFHLPIPDGVIATIGALFQVSTQNILHIRVDYIGGHQDLSPNYARENK